MTETGRRVLFSVLFAAVFFQTGAHLSQSLVNYPAWIHIGSESFPEYHRVITLRALPFLLLPRLAELVLALATLYFRPAAVKRRVLILAIALALCALLSTAIVQAPAHARLDAEGNTPELLSLLMASNWLRLILEWVRAALYLWMMAMIIRMRAPADSVKTEIPVDA